MNRLEEVQEKIRKNLEEEQKIKQEIEQSSANEELQGKSDYINQEKKEINQEIDNIITEDMRQIEKIEDFKQEASSKKEKIEKRMAKYEEQKEEFFAHFGRMPELSENSLKENTKQQMEYEKYNYELLELNQKIDSIQQEIEKIKNIKERFNNGECYASEKEKTAEVEEEAIILPNVEEIEEIKLEEIAPIEEIHVEEVAPAEEIEVEEVPIEEIKVEEIGPMEEIEIEQIQENTQNANETEEEIIIPEEIKQEEVQPLKEKIALLSIIAKIEDGELVYKAEVNNGETIKIYPVKKDSENLIANEKEKREEIKSLLLDYAVEKFKALDKKVIKRIDPIICAVLMEYAQKYDSDYKRLIYNYSMSFSKVEEVEWDDLPTITYNISTLSTLELKDKYKKRIIRNCKNASKNENIDMVDFVTGFRRILYIFKQLISANTIKALPEGKNN